MILSNKRRPLVVAIGLGLASLGLIPSGASAHWFCHRGTVVTGGQGIVTTAPATGGQTLVGQGLSMVPAYGVTSLAQSVPMVQSYAVVPVMNSQGTTNCPSTSGQQLVGQGVTTSQGIPIGTIISAIREILPLLGPGGIGGGIGGGGNGGTTVTGGGAITVHFPEPLRVVIQADTSGTTATAPAGSSGFPPLIQGGQGLASGQSGHGQALIQSQGVTAQSLSDRIRDVEADITQMKSDIAEIRKLLEAKAKGTGS
jgi:hypothetical protein